MKKKVRKIKIRNFASSLVWTEITKVKTSPNTEVGVVHIHAPAQYFAELQRLITSQFGSMKAFVYKSDKKDPFLQVRTGKPNNSVSKKIYEWVNQQRSQVYYENPSLDTNYSASQQGVPIVTGGSNEENNKTSAGSSNTLMYVIGGIVLLVILFVVFKKVCTFAQNV